MTAFIHELDERAVVRPRRASLHLTHEYLHRCVADYRELLYLINIIFNIKHVTHVIYKFIITLSQ